MSILVLVGMMILSIIGCLIFKNKIVKVLLGTASLFLFLLLILIAGIIYTTQYKIGQIDSASYGDYEVLFQSIGEPGWPFGPSDGRLVLKHGNNIVDKCDIRVYNDGKFLQEENWNVDWEDHYVQITLFGEEQDDAEYRLYFENVSD